jgi:hypothetical protein
LHTEFNSLAELFDPIWMTSDASLTRGPVSGRQVMQYECQLVIMQPFGEFLLLVVIREHKLDRAKARIAGCLEPVEKRQLGEQEA